MAVIGVSTTHDHHPANVIYNKNHLRYPVQTFAVNPKGGTLNREPVYRTVAEIDVSVDLAVIAVRSGFVPDVVSQCIEKGIKGAVIISGGFAETGSRDLQQEVADLAVRANFPFVGPNCLGIYSPEAVDTFFCRGSASFTPKRKHRVCIPERRVLVDQLVKFAGQGIGVSAAVSIGNKACIRETHLIDWFEQDMGTRVIAFYIEGFECREGREFVKRAQACSNRWWCSRPGRRPGGLPPLPAILPPWQGITGCFLPSWPSTVWRKLIPNMNSPRFARH